MPSLLNERDMLDALEVRYGKKYRNGATELERYIRAEHVRSTLGFESRRTLDFVAMDMWGSNYGPPEKRGPFLHGHEIKVSRSDWLTELRDPEKALAFSQYMHYFWLVVSDKDIVKPSELPEHWGLLAKHGRTLRVVTPAPLQRPEPMPLTMHGTLLRATVRTTRKRASA